MESADGLIVPGTDGRAVCWRCWGTRAASVSVAYSWHGHCASPFSWSFMWPRRKRRGWPCVESVRVLQISCEADCGNSRKPRHEISRSEKPLFTQTFTAGRTHFRTCFSLFVSRLLYFSLFCGPLVSLLACFFFIACLSFILTYFSLPFYSFILFSHSFALYLAFLILKKTYCTIPQIDL